MSMNHKSQHGNCTAGYYRKNLTIKLVESAADNPDITSILRAGVDHYGEQLRSLSHLDDASPEKLRSSLLFQTFKGSKAELSSKSPKTLIQDLLASINDNGLSDNFTNELGRRLQMVADTLPDEEAPPAPEEPIPHGEPIPEAGAGPAPAPEGEAAPAPEAPVGEEPAGEEPQETESDAEVSPDDFGDLVDKIQQ